MIRIEGLYKSFQGIDAVRDISLSVAPGEIFGLLGPNGAGKTTTLRMLTGLLVPDRGRIMIRGYDIVRQPVEAKSFLGYIPDRAFLYEKLTAQELLIFIASLYHMEKNAAMRQIEHLLDLFGLIDRKDELIESFSQGMRQRLLFASALVHDPDALVIDEPFTGLDLFGVKMLKDLLVGLRRKGTAVLLATHSLPIAEELCDKIGFINKGSLVSVTTGEEIRGFQGRLEELFLKFTF